MIKLLGPAPSGTTDSTTKSYVDALTLVDTRKAVATYTANRTADATDNVMLVSAASVSVTVTLPTAVGITGTVYLVKRTDTTYANTVTIATTASQTIDGITTYTKLWVQYAYVQVVSDGANWQIIDASSLDEAWINVTLAGQWSNRGAGFPVLKYKRLASPTNYMAVVGDVVFTSNGTTGLTSGATITTLPVGYRPATEQKLGGWPGLGGTLAANAELVVTVGANGTVKPFNLTSSNVNATTQLVEFNGIVSLDA